MKEIHQIIKMNNHNILQWHVQELRNKKDEVLKLVSDHTPLLLAIQETMMSGYNKFSIPNYHIFNKTGHFNWRSHGGVSILIHDSVPYRELKIISEVQAVAARDITLFYVFFAESPTNTADFKRNRSATTTPFFILGDLNGHSRIWGSRNNSARGNIIEEFLNTNNLNIMNDGSPTRVTATFESAIDMSICSPILQIQSIVCVTHTSRQ